MNKIIKNIPKIVLGFIIMVSGNVVSSNSRVIDEERLDQLLSGARSVVYNETVLIT